MFSKFECIFNAATVKLEVIVINASFLMRKFLTFYKFYVMGIFLFCRNKNNNSSTTLENHEMSEMASYFKRMKVPKEIKGRKRHSDDGDLSIATSAAVAHTKPSSKRLGSSCMYVLLLGRSVRQLFASPPLILV